jgi:DNA-binding protein HU-beta
MSMATAKEIVPKSLTKAQIITQLAEKNALTKKQVAAFLESFVELAYRETKKNKKFTIPGLGILKLNKRKARLGRNPATGEQIKIPAKTAVKLTVSSRPAPPKKPSLARQNSPA